MESSTSIRNDPPPASENPAPLYWGLWATIGFSVLALVLTTVIQSGIAIGGMISGFSSEVNIDLLIEDGKIIKNGDEFDPYTLIGGDVLALSIVISSVLTGLFILIIIKMRKGAGIKRYLNLHLPSIKKLLFWIAVLILLIIAGEILEDHIDTFSAEMFMQNIYVTSNYKWFLFLSVCFIAPIFEEILFRGFMFKGMVRSKLGKTGTVLLTSALFAVIHTQYNLSVIIMVFIVGILLGIARLNTKTLTVPIILHILNNTAGFIFIAVENS